MGAIFGDDVAVYTEDLHIDHRTHELVFDTHAAKSDNPLVRVATQVSVHKRPSMDPSKLEADHPSSQHVDFA